MVLLDKDTIRREYVKQIEQTKEMIDKQNANLNEIIDEQGQLKINEKVYYNNDNDSDSENESVEMDLNLNKVDDEEIVNTNGFKRRSEDEV